MAFLCLYVCCVWFKRTKMPLHVRSEHITCFGVVGVQSCGTRLMRRQTNIFLRLAIPLLSALRWFTKTRIRTFFLRAAEQCVCVCVCVHLCTCCYICNTLDAAGEPFPSLSTPVILGVFMFAILVFPRVVRTPFLFSSSFLRKQRQHGTCVAPASRLSQPSSGVRLATECLHSSCSRCTAPRTQAHYS